MAALPLPLLQDAADPAWIEGYAERLFTRYPEVLITLGHPSIPELFHVPASGQSCMEVRESAGTQILSVKLARRLSAPNVDPRLETAVGSTAMPSHGAFPSSCHRPTAVVGAPSEAVRSGRNGHDLNAALQRLEALADVVSLNATALAQVVAARVPLTRPGEAPTLRPSGCPEAGNSDAFLPEPASPRSPGNFKPWKNDLWNSFSSSYWSDKDIKRAAEIQPKTWPQLPTLGQVKLTTVKSEPLRFDGGSVNFASSKIGNDTESNSSGCLGASHDRLTKPESDKVSLSSGANTSVALNVPGVRALDKRCDVGTKTTMGQPRLEHDSDRTAKQSEEMQTVCAQVSRSYPSEPLHQIRESPAIGPMVAEPKVSEQSRWQWPTAPEQNIEETTGVCIKSPIERIQSSVLNLLMEDSVSPVESPLQSPHHGIIELPPRNGEPFPSLLKERPEEEGTSSSQQTLRSPWRRRSHSCAVINTTVENVVEDEECFRSISEGDLNSFCDAAEDPKLLSPGVLSPGVLSPGVLSPGVLSPGVLSPGSTCSETKRVSRRDRPKGGKEPSKYQSCLDEPKPTLQLPLDGGPAAAKPSLKFGGSQSLKFRRGVSLKLDVESPCSEPVAITPIDETVSPSDSSTSMESPSKGMKKRKDFTRYLSCPASPENKQPAVQLVSTFLGGRQVNEEEESNTDLRQSFGRQATVKRPLPGAFPNRRTIFFFDWDDTLCPTSFIRSLLKDHMAEIQEWAEPEDHGGAPMPFDWRDTIPPWFYHVLPDDPTLHESMSALQQAVINLINVTQSWGIMCIVTNAVPGWVEKTIKKWLPNLMPYVSGHGARPRIRVLYGQELYNSPTGAAASLPWCDELGEHMWWKKAAMDLALDDIDGLFRLDNGANAFSWCRTANMKRVANVVSIGDNEAEMQAVEICCRTLRTHRKPPPRSMSIGERRVCIDGKRSRPRRPHTVDTFVRARRRKSGTGYGIASADPLRAKWPWIKRVKFRDCPSVKQLSAQLTEIAELLPQLVALRKHIRMDFGLRDEALAASTPKLIQSVWEGMDVDHVDQRAERDLMIQTV